MSLPSEPSATCADTDVFDASGEYDNRPELGSPRRRIHTDRTTVAALAADHDTGLRCRRRLRDTALAGFVTVCVAATGQPGSDH
ncbi:hypothetical protein [Curtobacterium sp. MCPF17_052]|uniref:hypothetical protein n=1 Tax=Curtobacterium sp. MCPF17_052 TaxID=2175655 RepID=UPI0024DFD2EE|nr:hypothetical protein [Curtobacterium sp. MCPF17_052]WIB11414.1 hypothetical protein DEJ36_10325 [Curtobacterium sp. MCPF17_052]